MSNESVREKAEAYAFDQLSTADLYDWLSSRRTPIEDDLEADLWALVFEVSEKDVDERGAREWLAEKHRLVPPIPELSFVEGADDRAPQVQPSQFQFEAVTALANLTAQKLRRSHSTELVSAEFG